MTNEYNMKKGMQILKQIALPPRHTVYDILTPLVDATCSIYDSKAWGGMYSQVEPTVTNKVRESVLTLFNYLSIPCPIVIEFTSIRQSIDNPNIPMLVTDLRIDDNARNNVIRAYNEYINYNSMAYYYPDYDNMRDSIILYDLRHVLPKSHDSVMEMLSAISLYAADLTMPVIHECHHHISTTKMLKSGMTARDIILLKEVQSFYNTFESTARKYSVDMAEYLYRRKWVR